MTRPRRVFGPVPSRRLGRSLGVDLVPAKTCTYDCSYCQLGPTTDQTLNRAEYVAVDEVLEDLAGMKEGQWDWVTLSGSGEPTLHSGIGEVIRKARRLAKAPIAVLTNGSLLYDPRVREDLLACDLVMPTLSAVTETAFRELHRPHPDLEPARVLEGIAEFSQMFEGRIWVEVMLVKDVNDDEAELGRIRRWVDRIGPDRVHVNTVVRPPSRSTARPLSEEALEGARILLGPRAEIIGGFSSDEVREQRSGLSALIRDTLSRRPCTVTELADALGAVPSEVLKELAGMSYRREVEVVRHLGLPYYRLRR